MQKIKIKIRQLQFNCVELWLFLFNSEYRKELKRNQEKIFTK